ncbi:hypothetical protein SPBR_01063 [Sporothrix brasiliensis 5110]|uniref:Uncharacterized protein n=1 Tax=Sporothrix brasiliensis 5110 TaxID=1398154 RepID=A0A0C2FHK9_9PEZI|nr:uncharacterized protein SPBR_01063 [Sporothrix brasiliensis 5110]KIH90568.1 hypothetical protein SPBR_01063 [Sporothrix brasiliensis 5110]
MGIALSTASQALAAATAVVYMAAGRTLDDPRLYSCRHFLRTLTTPFHQRLSAMLMARRKLDKALAVVNDKTESPNVTTEGDYFPSAHSPTAVPPAPLIPLDAVTRAWVDERTAQLAEARAQHVLSRPLRVDDAVSWIEGSQRRQRPLMAMPSYVLATEKEYPRSGLWNDEVAWSGTQGL